MASNYIKVNTSTLKHDANELIDMANDAQNQLEKTFDSIMALDKMWDGPANEVFVRQFTSDYELLKALCKSVKSFAGDIKSAANEYDKCENSVENAVRSIRV